MMRKLFVLLRKDLLQLARTRVLVLVLVLCPVILVGIMPAGLTNQTRLKVDVVDRSFSAQGGETVACLARSPHIAQVTRSASLQESQERMDRGAIHAIVVLPADGGQPVILADGSHTILGYDAAWYVARQLADGKAAERPGPGPGVEEDAGGLRTHTLFVSGQDSVHYYMVPMLVLLMAVIGCCMAAFSTVTEIESKRIELLRSTGLGTGLYVLSKDCFGALIALAELAAGLVIARLVFDFSSAGPLGAFFILALCFLLAISSLGVLLAAWGKTQMRTVYLFVFLFVVLVLLSTMFVPLDNMSASWAATRFVNPLYWMVDGAWAILLKGFGLRAVLPHCIALLAIGAALSLLAALSLRKL